MNKNTISFSNYNIFPKSELFVKRRKLTFCYIAHTVLLKGLVHLVEAFSSIKDNNWWFNK